MKCQITYVGTILNVPNGTGTIKQVERRDRISLDGITDVKITHGQGKGPLLKLKHCGYWKELVLDEIGEMYFTEED
jgi:hypothetical protein